MNDQFSSALSSVAAALKIQCARYDRAALIERCLRDPLADDRFDFGGAQWQAGTTVGPTDETGALAFETRFAVTGGDVQACTVGIAIEFSDWSSGHYVLLPAVAYNGNRFNAWAKDYGAPISDSPFALSPDMEPLISRVPRLSKEPGRSAIQQLAGDLSTPAVGIRFATGRGLWLLFEADTPLGYPSVSLYESDDRSRATLIIQAPGVRDEVLYNGVASPDRGQSLVAGSAVTLRFAVAAFDAPDVQALYDRFLPLRRSLVQPGPARHELPFDACFAIQQAKQNAQNWAEPYGYYAVGMRENPFQDWQTGWTGGAISAYALLAGGNDLSRERGKRCFDFLFNSPETGTGFFYDVHHFGGWSTNGFRRGSPSHWTFLRRNSDACYFAMKALRWLAKFEPAFDVPERWVGRLRGSLDGYVNLWQRHGQFGQWVDLETGQIRLGRTASNAIACAALIMAGADLDEPRYTETALAAGAWYDDHHTRRGLTNGGPGDMLQCPDSESAAALVEAFIVLYEHTGDGRWLDAAGRAARQAATWVVSYDFRFPATSTFARLGMRTNGTVIANAQNKHSAPGICTLSGNSLLKLYRHTGERRYIDLLADIAHAIPQFLSREDRPIPDVRAGSPIPRMPPGWINERVNMSDWEERHRPGQDIGRGEIFAGSCWCETSMMLTHLEVPGIVVSRKAAEVIALDHVNVEQRGDQLSITNPTKFDTTVKLIAIDDTTATLTPIDHEVLAHARRIDLPAGATANAAV